MSSEARQERWGMFTSKEFQRRKNAANLALVRASVEDGRFLSLNPVEQRIISERFYPEDGAPTSFSELAKELGLGSASSAKRAQENILKKLRKAKG